MAEFDPNRTQAILKEFGCGIASSTGRRAVLSAHVPMLMLRQLFDRAGQHSHLWAADSQLVALYAEKACLILIWTGVDFVPRHIDPDRHPVFFNSILARISQHRIQQSCLLFKILGGSAMGSCKNDYPLTFRGEHQS